MDHSISVSWESMGLRYEIEYAGDGVWLRVYNRSELDAEMALGTDLKALQKFTNAATAIEITAKEMGDG